MWIADYVLMGYGTGAIMAVPGARRARLRVRQEVRPADPPSRGTTRRRNKPEPLARGRALRRGRQLAQCRASRSTACRPPRRKPGSSALARSSRQSASARRQLQAARLAVRAPALLGRAVPGPLAGRQALAAAGERAAPPAARPRRLQAHRHRRAAPGKATDWVRYSDAATPRDQHDAPVGRVVLVLTCATATRKTTQRFVGRGTRALLDGRRQPGGSIFTSAAPSTPCCT